MSFILDALKKIEQDKRRSDGGQVESIAVSRSRFGSRQPVLAMVAIAAGSALLTAAAVSLLNNPKPPDDVVGDTPSSVAEVVSAPLAAETAPEIEVAPRASRPPAAPPVVREASLPAGDVGLDESAQPERDEEAIAVEENDVDSVSATQDIRIVGRERALLDGLNIENPDRARADQETEPEGDVDEPLPEGFPDLVLQGTSVIGEDAVAVISDQRVFEGDRIEGALVIRIGTGEVELELEGRRFTLRL